jgi:hypothetical protein
MGLPSYTSGSHGAPDMYEVEDTPVHGLKNAIAGKSERDCHRRWVEV